MLRVKKIDAIIPGQAPDTRRFSHFNSTRPSPAPTWLITSGKISQHKPEKQTKFLEHATSNRPVYMLLDNFRLLFRVVLANIPAGWKR